MLAPGFEAALTSVAPASAAIGAMCVIACALGRGGAARAPEVSMRAAQAVAAIQDEIRPHRRRDRAVRDRMVDTPGGKCAELRRERALRQGCAREDHQAARLFVQPVHDAERGVEAGFTRPPQRRPRVVGERVLVPRPVGHAEHARRLSTTTTSRSRYTIALSASGSVRSFGPSWSTTTTAPGNTRAAGSRQRWPSTVTRPSAHNRRARDHDTPVCSRTTAAMVGSVVRPAATMIIEYLAGRGESVLSPERRVRS
jgi:hypothetical protein